MAKRAEIPIEELSEETREKLGLQIAPTIDEVGAKLVVLGKVFKALKGLSDSECHHPLLSGGTYAQPKYRKTVSSYGQLTSLPSGREIPP